MAEMGKVKNRGLLMRSVRVSISAPLRAPSAVIHPPLSGGAITLVSVNPK